MRHKNKTACYARQFYQNVWQPCIHSDEASLTRSFATLAFASLLYGIFRC